MHRSDMPCSLYSDSMENSHSSSSVHRPVALVTGAGSGIGKAAAIEFAQKGCNVIVADCDLEGATETCKMIQDAAPGVESLAVLCDITCPVQVAAMIEAAKNKFGRLDYAFNNAGIAGSKADAVHELPLEVFDAVMSVNLRGHFIAMQAQIPLMLSTSPAPAIVLTASVAGHYALPGISPYVISKHAVLGLAKVAAAEYGPRGLRVNSVSPGFIKTPIHEKGAAAGIGVVVRRLAREGAKISSTTATAASCTSADEGTPAVPNSRESATNDAGSASASGHVETADGHAEAPAGAVEHRVNTDAGPTCGTTEVATAAEADEAKPTDAETSRAAEAAFRIPLRRPGEAQDVAELVVWLCMHGSYITGSDVTIDGGMRSIIGA